jgi:hypothetical protein
MADFSAITVGNNTYNVKDATARSGLAGKQDTLTAGTGISIVSNVISATGGGGNDTWSSAVSKAVGSTSVTISDPAIATTSAIDIYCQNTSGTPISLSTVVATTGQVVVSFDALTEATSFKAHIFN